METKSCAMMRADALADLFEIVRLGLLLPQPVLADGMVAGTLIGDVHSIANDFDIDMAGLKEWEDDARAEAAALDSERMLHIMRYDYDRLFTHPNNAKAPIYESLFLFRQSGGEGNPPALFLNPVAGNARRHYEAAGFDRVDDGGFNVSPDHMALEVEFTAHLLRAVGQSGGITDPLERRAVADELSLFWNEHLNCWMPAFFACVESAASTAFYRYIAAVVRLLVLRTGLTPRDVAEAVSADMR